MCVQHSSYQQGVSVHCAGVQHVADSLTSKYVNNGDNRRQAQTDRHVTERRHRGTVAVVSRTQTARDATRRRTAGRGSWRKVPTGSGDDVSGFSLRTSSCDHRCSRAVGGVDLVGTERIFATVAASTTVALDSARLTTGGRDQDDGHRYDGCGR
jgi:hypothetical protein